MQDASSLHVSSVFGLERTLCPIVALFTRCYFFVQWFLHVSLHWITCKSSDSLPIKETSISWILIWLPSPLPRYCAFFVCNLFFTSLWWCSVPYCTVRLFLLFFFCSSYSACNCLSFYSPKRWQYLEEIEHPCTVHFMCSFPLIFSLLKFVMICVSNSYIAFIENLVYILFAVIF